MLVLACSLHDFHGIMLKHPMMSMHEGHPRCCMPPKFLTVTTCQSPSRWECIDRSRDICIYKYIHISLFIFISRPSLHYTHTYAIVIDSCPPLQHSMQYHNPNHSKGLHQQTHSKQEPPNITETQCHEVPKASPGLPNLPPVYCVILIIQQMCHSLSLVIPFSLL